MQITETFYSLCTSLHFIASYSIASGYTSDLSIYKQHFTTPPDDSLHLSLIYQLKKRRFIWWGWYK